MVKYSVKIHAIYRIVVPDSGHNPGVIMTDKNAPTSKTDLIYSAPHQSIKDFRFDEQVVEVFPDMIKRSVPGYNTIIDTIGKLSQQYAQDNSNLYDLGCSLGEATLAMRRAIKADNCHIIGVDNSSAMVERCTMHVNAFKGETPCTILLDDILNIPLENASVIVLNFTLQFIEPELREQLMAKIANALLPGGIFILSEKINATDANCQQLLIDLHHTFKRANGYSELEIAQKRSAIENIMKPDSLDTHIKRLNSVGFQHITPWFQCFNFMSLVAIK
jgi:tRNA (cmo5U34)-methyltransferase